MPLEVNKMKASELRQYTDEELNEKLEEQQELFLVQDLSILLKESEKNKKSKNNIIHI